MKKTLLLCCLFTAIALIWPGTTWGQSKHSPTSNFPTYKGRVMAGYQGWFRAEGDGSGQGWQHYSERGPLRPESIHPDMWPDVDEYEKTYPTTLKLADGSPARLFSSWDASTTNLHFQWMKEYGVDGVFMQRFFGVTRSPRSREQGRVILRNALQAAQEHGRAIAVMYDLSGIRDEGEDCSSIIQDWKELVDELKVTSQPTNNYLYHRGKPLVTIWGLGFPDRGYDIQKIGMDKLVDFLKNDPEYGGCSVMLGVPTYFRELHIDTNPDPYLHTLIESADVMMPWTVQRYTPLLHLFDKDRYYEDVKQDVAWCKEHGVDYAACVWPGFSWHNMHRPRRGDNAMLYPLNQIPRQKGRFYWQLIGSAVKAKSEMLYVAMFDEIDEATAIMKVTNDPPVDAPFVDLEGVPTDQYLWLTGQAGKMLRGEIPFTERMPRRERTGEN